MDGLAALKELRQVDPAACVTMLTAMGQPAIVLDALKSGAKDSSSSSLFDSVRLLAAVQKMIA